MHGIWFHSLPVDVLQMGCPWREVCDTTWIILEQNFSNLKNLVERFGIRYVYWLCEISNLHTVFFNWFKGCNYLKIRIHLHNTAYIREMVIAIFVKLLTGGQCIIPWRRNFVCSAHLALIEDSPLDMSNDVCHSHLSFLIMPQTARNPNVIKNGYERTK